MKLIPIVLGILLTTQVHAEGIHGGHNMSTEYLSPEQQMCYAKAMIGFDSVVNSRVGSYPEHALDLVVDDDLPEKHPMSRLSLLKTIWGAYLFKGPAHAYAVQTFAKCIAG